MNIPEISVRALAERLAQPDPPVLLDVRLSWENEKAALPGSLLIPLHELPEQTARLEALRGREVVVYCHHGVRSLHAAAFLQNLGVDARSLAGGIDRWAAEIDPATPRY